MAYLATSNATRSPGELHRQALRAKSDEMARLLQAVLGRRLTSYIVGADGKTIQRWARGDGAQIRSIDVERRLRLAFEVTLLLLQVDAASTVRAWFIGTNEYLDDGSPADAIRQDRLVAVLDAARSFASSA